MNYSSEDRELIGRCLQLPELAPLTALDFRIWRPEVEPATVVIHLAVPVDWISTEALARATRAACRLASPHYDTMLLTIGPSIPGAWTRSLWAAATTACAEPRQSTPGAAPSRW